MLGLESPSMSLQYPTMPDGGNSGVARSSATCLSYLSMSGKLNAGTASRKSKIEKAASARMPITAILLRIKPSSVSSGFEGKYKARRAERVPHSDLDLRVRSSAVRKPHVDLV